MTDFVMQYPPRPSGFGGAAEYLTCRKGNCFPASERGKTPKSPAVAGWFRPFGRIFMKNAG